MTFKLFFKFLGVGICVGLLFVAGQYSLQAHASVLAVGFYLGAAFVLGRALDSIFNPSKKDFL